MNKLLLVMVLVSLFFNIPTSAADLGDPVGYIDIPSLGFYRPVYEITDEESQMDELGYELGRVGHLADTPWIFSPSGRVVLVGHTPGAFETLINVNIGDKIYLSDLTGLVEYTVVNAYLASVYCYPYCSEQTIEPTLLLITCVYGNVNMRWLVEAIPSTQTP